jgi:hypothetical protein
MVIDLKYIMKNSYNYLSTLIQIYYTQCRGQL